MKMISPIIPSNGNHIHQDKASKIDQSLASLVASARVSRLAIICRLLINELSFTTTCRRQALLTEIDSTNTIVSLNMSGGQGLKLKKNLIPVTSGIIKVFY